LIPNVGAVNPQLETVVVKGFQAQKADDSRILNNECFPKKKAGVIAGHVVQGGTHGNSRIITNRCRA
jgi:hypothetical protein